MRRRAIWLAMATLALVLSASPAYAQGWRWLEKLSGPGDFYGYELDVKLWCQYQKKGEPRAIPISLPCLNKPDDAAIDITDRVYAFGASVSYLRGHNDLIYAPAPTGEEEINRTLQLWVFEAFYDHRTWVRRVDWGVAAGVNLFLLPNVADNNVLWRGSIEPRITFELFDLSAGGRYTGKGSLRIGALFFTNEFTAEDFGAVPGTYDSGFDWSPSIRFVLDFDRNPLKTPLRAPEVVAPFPVHVFTVGQVITIDWIDVSGAADYTIDFSNSPDFPAATLKTSTVQRSEFTTKELSDGTWWFRVRARGTSGALGEWSGPRKLEVEVPAKK